MLQYIISIDKQHDETSRPNFGGGNTNHSQGNAAEIEINYHREDTFTNVSLNLLARYEQQNLTAAETIQATLVSHEERSAFYEALCFHKSKMLQMGASCATSSMLHKIDQVFGAELKSVCSMPPPAFVVSLPAAHQRYAECTVQAPMTPRNDRNPATANSFQHFLQPRASVTTPHCFFPDSGPRSCRYMMQKKMQTQDIDWQLAGALQQVASMSLTKTEAPVFSRHEMPSPAMTMPFRTE